VSLILVTFSRIDVCVCVFGYFFFPFLWSAWNSCFRWKCRKFRKKREKKAFLSEIFKILAKKRCVHGMFEILEKKWKMTDFEGNKFRDIRKISESNHILSEICEFLGKSRKSLFSSNFWSKITFHLFRCEIWWNRVISCCVRLSTFSKEMNFEIFAKKWKKTHFSEFSQRMRIAHTPATSDITPYPRMCRLPFFDRAERTNFEGNFEEKEKEPNFQRNAFIQQLGTIRECPRNVHFSHKKR
jgi:hypothetical protein